MIAKVKIWVLVFLVIIIFISFPLFLNWILLKEALFPVIGDGTAWLAFWPVYLSSIASFCMIFFTYRSLKQNIKHTEELRALREEDERARLAFSIIVYQTSFMLKIRNVGKRDVYNAVINFNEEFLSELMHEKYEQPFRQLSSPFFVEAGTSRHLFLGFCQDINDAWKNKKVIIKMTGRYNDVYSIDEEIDMSLFLNKTFMLVQGDLETTMSYIKKGLIVQNNSYMPVQKSLDSIAKSLDSVQSSLDKIIEHFDEAEVEGTDSGYTII